MSKDPPRRGRRPSIAPGLVSLVAIDLFERRDYDDVSMDDIAEAAGVSRSSLFRLFPTKSSLLWDGYEPYLSALGALIETTAVEEDPFAAVERCLVDALPREPSSRHAVRVRLRIVASHPDLWVTAAPSMITARDLIVELLRRTTDGSPLERLVQAETAVSTSFTAMRLWALSDDDEPIEAVIHRGMLVLSAWGRDPANAQQPGSTDI
jgi:AcrR family transcriptional regulator